MSSGGREFIDPPSASPKRQGEETVEKDQSFQEINWRCFHKGWEPRWWWVECLHLWRNTLEGNSPHKPPKRLAFDYKITGISLSPDDITTPTALQCSNIEPYLKDPKTQTLKEKKSLSGTQRRSKVREETNTRLLEEFKAPALKAKADTQHSLNPTRSAQTLTLKSSVPQSPVANTTCLRFSKTLQGTPKLKKKIP